VGPLRGPLKCNTVIIIIIMVRGCIAPDRKNIKNIAHNDERRCRRGIGHDIKNIAHNDERR